MNANMINLENEKDIKQWLQSEEIVYVGRPNNIIKDSKWGNPYKLQNHENRQQVIHLFEQYTLRNNDLAHSFTELRGKNLGFYCAPAQCHAEVLHQLAGNIPIYQMATAASNTMQFKLTNLGTNVSVEDVHQFLGFANTDDEKKLCSVALSVKAGQNFAFAMVPQHMGARVEER